MKDAPYPLDCKIPREVLDKMRREFHFWYPVDLRCSGKDLIQNHLTFFIYNHCAIWPDDDRYWPKSIRANGHLLLNSAKVTLKYFAESFNTNAYTTFELSVRCPNPKVISSR